jgi:transcriptional regulator with XRE-family HTH domain
MVGMARDTRKRRRPALATRIRTARIAAGLSQREVARRLGVAAPSVHEWESGASRPRLSRIVGLADLLGLAVADLLGEKARAA